MSGDDAAPVAVIDIGSNSIRLVVYDRHARSPFPRFNEKSLCGLGKALDATGELPSSAFECTLKALERFVGIARAMRAVRIDVIATEAVRRAGNGPALVEAARARAGCEMRILSGEEEARMAALGVASGFYAAHGLMGDLGGGSLELCSIHRGEVTDDLISLPLGTLRVDPLLARGPDVAKAAVDRLLKDALPKGGIDTFYAVGGSWRALARVHMAMDDAPLHNVHGYEIPFKKARALTKALRGVAAGEAAGLPGVPPRRVPQVAAAALVLDRVLKRLAPERIVFSALGVREGWLYATLPEHERTQDPLNAGARDFGRPRARVPEIGPAMIRWTDALFIDETPAETRLRHAACELSDIGWRDHPDVRATDTFHRLSQLPFIGLDHKERVHLAAIVHARYDGRDDEPSLQPALSLLAARERGRAQVLGRAMRLGYRFSGSVPALLGQARLRIGPDVVRLEVGTDAALPDSEPVRACLKSLAKALGLRRAEIRVVSPSTTSD
ncbi:MAG: Ppx/GppA family phosphatase [Geminicoccaceae bacterium]|nr:Ppx/GppA family phosphatase [Geminicoccaceae bacterium]